MCVCVCGIICIWCVYIYLVVIYQKTDHLYQCFLSTQTEELNKKLEALGEGSLRQFTLDVPTNSVYQFEGEDYR